MAIWDAFCIALHGGVVSETLSDLSRSVVEFGCVGVGLRPDLCFDRASGFRPRRQDR